MDTEANLVYRLSPKVDDDIREIWQRPEISRGEVAWPASIVLHRKGTDHLIIGFEDGSDQKLECYHSSNRTLPERLTFQWNMTVTQEGSVLAVPRPYLLERPTPEQLPLIARLMKMAEIEPHTYQLRERLAPYLPDIAVSDETLDLFETEGNGVCQSNWGYISDVRAFRAALIDELKKPF